MSSGICRARWWYVATAVAYGALVAGCAAVPANESVEEPVPRPPALQVPDGLDFGSAVREGESQSGYIINTSDRAVRVSSVGYEGPRGFDVYLTRDKELVDAPVVLESGERIGVLVICTSGQAHDRAGEVVIHTDDQTPPYVILVGRIRAEIRGCVEVRPSAVIDFGRVPVGESRTRSFELISCERRGDHPGHRLSRASFEARLAEGAFAFTPLEDSSIDQWVEWRAGNPISVEVTFTPQRVGEVETLHHIDVAHIARYLTEDCTGAWYGYDTPDIWKQCSQYNVRRLPITLKGRGHAGQ